MNHIISINSSVKLHLCCFQVLAIIHNTVYCMSGCMSSRLLNNHTMHTVMPCHGLSEPKPYHWLQLNPMPTIITYLFLQYQKWRLYRPLKRMCGRLCIIWHSQLYRGSWKKLKLNNYKLKVIRKFKETESNSKGSKTWSDASSHFRGFNTIRSHHWSLCYCQFSHIIKNHFCSSFLSIH